MKRVTCYYYHTESGRLPAKDFIASLDPKSRRKFFVVRELLEEFGHQLGIPHNKYIGDDIYELRFYGREGAIRALYFFFHQDKAIFTNGFMKKSQKTPDREKELALARRKLFFMTHREEGENEIGKS